MRGSLIHSHAFGGRRYVRTLPIAAIGLSFITSTARAQFGTAGGMGAGKEPMVRVGFGGGVTVPVSDAKDALKNGVNGAGFVLVNLFGGTLPALRFAFTYDRFDFKPTVATNTTGTTSTTDPGTSRIIGGTGGIKIHLVPGPIRPFVMAGIGAFNVQDLLNATNGQQISASKTNFGVDGGGGIELKLGRVSAFAEGRIQNVFTQSGGLIKRSSIQSVPVTFGLLF